MNEAKQEFRAVDTCPESKYNFHGFNFPAALFALPPGFWYPSRYRDVTLHEHEGALVRLDAYWYH